MVPLPPLPITIGVPLTPIEEAVDVSEIVGAVINSAVPLRIEPDALRENVPNVPALDVLARVTLSADVVSDK